MPMQFIAALVACALTTLLGYTILSGNDAGSTKLANQGSIWFHQMLDSASASTETGKDAANDSEVTTVAGNKLAVHGIVLGQTNAEIRQGHAAFPATSTGIATRFSDGTEAVKVVYEGTDYFFQDDVLFAAEVTTTPLGIDITSTRAKMQETYGREVYVLATNDPLTNTQEFYAAYQVKEVNNSDLAWWVRLSQDDTKALVTKVWVTTKLDAYKKLAVAPSSAS